MANLTVQDIADESEITFVSADAAGDAFTNDGMTCLLVQNGSGTTLTLTFAKRTTSDTDELNQASLVDYVPPAVPTDSLHFGRPMHPDFYNDANGRATFTYSQTANVGVAAVRIRPARKI